MDSESIKVLAGDSKFGGDTKDTNAGLGKSGGLSRREKEKKEENQEKSGAVPKDAKKSPDTKISVIGDDLSIEGENLVVTSQGNLRVDGVIQGEVRSVHLTVGKTARIAGAVYADQVIIEGEVEGVILGERVELAETAHVEGDIFHGTLVVKEGAYFNGASRRPEDLKELKPKPRNAATPPASGKQT